MKTARIFTPLELISMRLGVKTEVIGYYLEGVYYDVWRVCFDHGLGVYHYYGSYPLCIGDSERRFLINCYCL